MKVTMIDNRDWRDPAKKEVDINDLSDKWDAVVSFIEDMKNVTITIRVDGGQHGTLFISSPDRPMKDYSLFIWDEKVLIAK